MTGRILGMSEPGEENASGDGELIDAVTGGVVPPMFVLVALAAMGVVLGVGIRREVQRW